MAKGIKACSYNDYITAKQSTIKLIVAIIGFSFVGQ